VLAYLDQMIRTLPVAVPLHYCKRKPGVIGSSTDICLWSDESTLNLQVLYV